MVRGPGTALADERARSRDRRGAGGGGGAGPERVRRSLVTIGFLIEAARQPGANVFKVREVSRHRSLDILAEYVRSHDGFREITSLCQTYCIASLP